LILTNLNFGMTGKNRLAELAIEVTDEAFSVCGIPEREQQEEW